MKIPSVETELLQADMAKLTVAFRNFVKAPNDCHIRAGGG